MPQPETDKNQTSPADTVNHTVAFRKKPAKKGWLFILVALVLIVIITLRDSFRSIDWIDNYASGVEMAKQLDMPILLMFQSSDSPDCDKMMKYTYGSLNVIKYVTANFVPVRIDADDNKSLVDKYDISQYPTQVVIAHRTGSFATIPGYVVAGEFTGRLRNALKRTSRTPSPSAASPIFP